MVNTLERFVEKIQAEYPAAYVPRFDPNDGGIGARVLFLFEKPGPMTDQRKKGSGIISRDNDDQTARAISDFMNKADINRKDTILWNIIPLWNQVRLIRAEEMKIGITLLEDLLESVLQNVKVIVLVGRQAQRATNAINKRFPGRYTILTSAHPSPIVHARFPERWDNIPNEWRQVHNYL